MADLPSILGGLAQGFVDFGKGAVDMFGTGGAAIGDLIEGARTGKVTTKNQDDFRKWLYQTDSTKDAAAKGLGTALNGVQTVLDYIPGVNVLTRNPLGNAAQGALGGLADEFKTYGEDYDLGRAGQRAAVSAAGAAASGSLADALKGSSNALLSSNTLQGLARGATGGAITGGGYAAIDGGNVLEAAKQGAGMGALIGGATGAFQDFKPAKTYDVALTDDERAARIANAKNMLANEQNPERIAELNNQIKDLGGTPENTVFYHGQRNTPSESGDTLGSGLYVTSNKDRAAQYADGGDVLSYDTNGLRIANLDNNIPDDVIEVLNNNPELRAKLNTLTPATDFFDNSQRDKAYALWKELQQKYPMDQISSKRTDAGYEITYPKDADLTKITGKDLFRKLYTPEAQNVFMGAGYDGVSKTALGGDTEMAIYRNAPKNLEATLADADMAVNGVTDARSMLAKRLSGDALNDALDLADTLRGVGADIDDNGYVSLYHRTSPEAAKRIYDTGEMVTKEPGRGLYWSTNRGADSSQGYGDSVVTAKVPLEKLQLDDIFDNNADVVLSTDNKGSLDVSKYLVPDNAPKALGATLADADNRQAQFDLLQKTNPMRDGYHTGIRSPEDIYTLKSIVDSYNADNNFTYPDFTLADAQKALASGNIDVYSSKPIEAGAFISPSKMMATDYAGGGEVYTKNIPLRDFAFIESGDEGNYLPTARALETTLADADMAVNNPRYLTDENGNPRTFYHGSPNKNITEFDINQAGKNTSSGEHALYFTDSPEVADEFSYERLPSDSMFVDNRGAKGRVYPVNLAMDNPLDLSNLSDKQIEELWQYASPLGKLDGKEKFIKNMKAFRDYGNDQLIKTNLDLDKLANSQYDGFMARMYPNQDNQAREYAVFDNSKVKMLEDVLANDDAAVNAAKLTPEQEAYFKDSVIRDENGNLMPLYHGSNSKFTVFDSSKGGQSNKTAKVGHWFTPSEEGAKNFANSVWYGDESEPTVYSTYLNVKNPKIYEAVDNSAQIKALNNEMDSLQRQLDGMRRGSDDFNATYKKYNDLAKQIENLSYGDPYEQFRSDIYAMEGKTPYQANVGGLGMMMDDENAATQKYVQSLRDQGYDGIIIRGTNYDNGTLGGVNDQYVVFDSNQIKNTSNLRPTENPDIRYSKAAPGKSLEKTLASSDAEINRVGSDNVAPVDPTTLPDSLKAVQDYLDEGNYIKDIENFAGKPYPKLTNQDYLDYAISLKNPKDKAFYESIIKDMVDDGTTTYEKYAASAARNNRLNKLRMGSYNDIDPKALASYVANHRQALSNGAIRDVDAELSDRLGIGRSNTLMMDNNLPPDALGVYDPTKTALSIDTRVPEENAINTLAHERLHSFQTEGDFKRYDKRVTDAYEELSKDLNKYLKTPEETAKRYAFDTDYWGNEREQQSRMLQQYLENKGFTRGGLQKSNAGEWGNEINPAFDKFFDKLRDLSKRGVALPALAALFGGGAYMASQENDKEKEVK